MITKLWTAANPNCLNWQNNSNIALLRSATCLASDFTNRVRTILFLKESIFEPPQTKQSHILDRLLSHRFHLTWRHCLRSNVPSQNWKEWKKTTDLSQKCRASSVDTVSTLATAKKWCPPKLKYFRIRASWFEAFRLKTNIVYLLSRLCHLFQDNFLLVVTTTTKKQDCVLLKGTSLVPKK